MKALFQAFCAPLAIAALVAAAGAAASNSITLPEGWRIEEPPALVAGTDTFPQGAAVSPNGQTIAVLCSGYNAPTLRLYSVRDLEEVASIRLDGAFGRPVWSDGTHVLIAGANADAILNVDTTNRSVTKISLGKGSYPTGVARRGETIAVATDGDLSVRIAPLDRLAAAKAIPIGGHVGELVFSRDGSTVFASNRSASAVVAIDARTHAVRRYPTGLHPSALLVLGNRLYVAETDADSIGVYDTIRGTKLGAIFVGDAAGGRRFSGVSPNALAASSGYVFVSLGAANAIAIVKGQTVAGRVPAGRYPTDVVPAGNRLYVINGKGEGTTANPYYHRKNFYDYVASLEGGSIRVYDRASGNRAEPPQGALGWDARPADTVLRAGGPIRHVFFILKENRSYDQVLGDAPGGNGDPKLAAFGARVTPNEHALAARFGLFDNAYTNGEVSEAGHDWSDAAFVTDYVQRTWPIDYSDRGGTQNPSLTAARAIVPRNGYIWQAARAAGVSFRDYGEFTNVGEFAIATLNGAYDKRYVSFDLKYSDVDRFKEWKREFDGFVARGHLPQLEYVWLPNDHTAGSKAGAPTPVAYVAQNDYAVGLFVQAISHSPVWKSSAIFIIEDDSQDGPDHVSDQRTTLYVVSPYMRGGLQHQHYNTTSVLRSMELILGMPPLSTYDGMALPLYAAFGTTADLTPYNVIAPKVSLTAKNAKVAYGSALSARIDLSRADAAPPGVLLDILNHNADH